MHYLSKINKSLPLCSSKGGIFLMLHYPLLVQSKITLYAFARLCFLTFNRLSIFSAAPLLYGTTRADNLANWCNQSFVGYISENKTRD